MGEFAQGEYLEIVIDEESSVGSRLVKRFYSVISESSIDGYGLKPGTKVYVTLQGKTVYEDNAVWLVIDIDWD